MQQYIGQRWWTPLCGLWRSNTPCIYTITCPALQPALVPMTYLPGCDLTPTSFMISMSGDFPVYVLDKKISDGNKLLRWMPCSHRGVYIGMSPLHSSSVPLVLNPSTGSITPQFHVVFDDWFGSIAVSPDDTSTLMNGPRCLVTVVSCFF